MAISGLMSPKVPIFERTMRKMKVPEPFAARSYEGNPSGAGYVSEPAAAEVFWPPQLQHQRWTQALSCVIYFVYIKGVRYAHPC
jgi:hypothetical protein